MRNFTIVVGISLLTFFPVISFANYEISDGSIHALYHLNNDAVDSSGHGYNGTDSGGNYFSGKLNQAFHCTKAGSSQVALPDGALPGAFPLSVGYWIRSTSTGYVAVNAMGGANQGWRAGTQDVANRESWMGFASLNVLNATASTSDGNWHKFDFTIDSGGNGTIYRDGVSDNTAGSLTITAIQAGISALCNNVRNGIFSDIDLDEVYIATTTLSSTQISNLYNAGAGAEICVTVGCQSTSSSGSGNSTSSCYTGLCMFSTSTDAALGNIFKMSEILITFGLVLLIGSIVYKFVNRNRK